MISVGLIQMKTFLHCLPTISTTIFQFQQSHDFALGRLQPHLSHRHVRMIYAFHEFHEVPPSLLIRPRLYIQKAWFQICNTLRSNRSLRLISWVPGIIIVFIGANLAFLTITYLFRTQRRHRRRLMRSWEGRSVPSIHLVNHCTGWLTGRSAVFAANRSFGIMSIIGS